MLSGVVKSVNQNAPPSLKEGTFSAMLETCIHMDIFEIEKE